jgi:rhodanese-related sulfurtransferase
LQISGEAYIYARPSFDAVSGNSRLLLANTLLPSARCASQAGNYPSTTLKAGQEVPVSGSNAYGADESDSNMAIRKIRRFEDLLSIPDKNAPVVTLFSGGLDSSYLLSFLFEAGFKRVTAICIDLGEGVEVGTLEKTSSDFVRNF